MILPILPINLNNDVIKVSSYPFQCVRESIQIYKALVYYSVTPIEWDRIFLTYETPQLVTFTSPGRLGIGNHSFN